MIRGALGILQRFEGESGRRLRLATLQEQRIVAGNVKLAGELADRIALRALPVSGPATPR